MADVQAADAAGEVDERVPVDVGQRRSVTAIDHDGDVDRERVGHDQRLPLQDLLGARPGDRRPELDRLRRRHHRSRLTQPAAGLHTLHIGLSEGLRRERLDRVDARRRSRA
jgi:hypothetical protein